MHQKITLTEMERLYSHESGKNMFIVYPKTKTLNFIKQFACVYHTERELPLQLAAIILN